MSIKKSTCGFPRPWVLLLIPFTKLTCFCYNCKRQQNAVGVHIMQMTEEEMRAEERKLNKEISRGRQYLIEQNGGKQLSGPQRVDETIEKLTDRFFERLYGKK